MVKVLLFATARQAAGTNAMDIPATNAQQVVSALSAFGGEPMTRLLAHCSVMVDGVRVTELESALVNEHSEVAILPPVSGGC